MAEQLNLDELERIGKAGTQAPVTAGESLDEPGPVYLVGANSLFSGRFVGPKAHDDARFYMIARNNWQALIDRIRELEARTSITRSYERPPLVIDDDEKLDNGMDDLRMLNPTHPLFNSDGIQR